MVHDCGMFRTHDFLLWWEGGLLPRDIYVQESLSGYKHMPHDLKDRVWKDQAADWGSR